MKNLNVIFKMYARSIALLRSSRGNFFFLLLNVEIHIWLDTSYLKRYDCFSLKHFTSLISKLRSFFFFIFFKCAILFIRCVWSIEHEIFLKMHIPRRTVNGADQTDQYNKSSNTSRVLQSCVGVSAWFSALFSSMFTNYSSPQFCCAFFFLNWSHTHTQTKL